MKAFLTALFGGIFVLMVIMTVRTSFQQGLAAALPSFRSNPWAIATLYDAYFGFITFFLWVAYRETNLWVKVLWLILWGWETSPCHSMC
jgi:hypothetical protein